MGFFDWVGDVVGKVKDGIGTVVGKVSDVYNGIGNVVGKVMSSPVGDIVRAVVPSTIRDTASDVYNGVGAGLNMANSLLGKRSYGAT
jgi:ABC-type transporter lipoprotein component MlaA